MRDWLHYILADGFWSLLRHSQLGIAEKIKNRYLHQYVAVGMAVAGCLYH